MGSQSAVLGRPTRWSIAVVTLIALLCAGCATGGAGDETETRPNRIDLKLDVLSSLAFAPEQVPAPPGLPAELFGPALSSVDADLTLDEAIDRYVSMDVPVAGVDPAQDDPPSPDDERRAVQSYASARLAYLDGELRQAERLIRESLDLDRTSGASWQLLAEIYEAGGESGVAIQVYEEALRREPDNLQSLFRVGSYVARAGRSDLAARLLAPVVREVTPGRDPAVRSLALTRFGLAMFDLGAWRAAETALIESAELLPRAAASAGRLRDELIQLDRNGADILIVLGDISLHLGDAAAARERYDGAAARMRLPGPDLIRRRMLASLRAGRPASAANVLLGTIDEKPGILAVHHAPLVRYLLEVTKLEDEIGRELSRRADARPDQEVIQLIAAMAEPIPAARARLYAVVQRPDCTRASRVAYISTFERPGEALAAVAERVHERPVEVEAWTRALMSGRSPIDWSTPLANTRTTERGGLLLRAVLLGQLGRWDEADAIGLQLEQDAEAFVAFLLATGRNADVPAAAERLDDPAAALRARIEAAGRSQQFLLALDLSTELVEQHTPTADDLLRHAGLLAQQGRHDDQVEAIEHALEVRPGFEAAYVELIRIHNAQGALPDARRLSAVVQRMGTERPGSASLRQLRAEEALSNQQFAVASMLLRELLEVEPDRETLAVTLIDAWTAAGQQQRIESWLEPRLAADRPGRGIVTAAARYLLQVGRADDAVDLLAAWIDRYPIDLEMQRRHESALRQRGDADLARELAIERIEAFGASRQSPEMRLAHASALLASGDLTSAVEVLARMPDDITLRSTQRLIAVRLLSVMLDSYRLELTDGTFEGVDDQAFDVINRLRTRSGIEGTEYDEGYFHLVTLRVATLLTESRHEPAIELLREAERSDGLPQVAAGLFQLEPDSATLVESMYSAASWRGMSRDSVEAVLQLVLELDPDHVLANNDLGYSWVERDINVEEAVRLIERAYALDPTEPHIIDSMGWARYKQGIFVDQTEGDEVMRGAVSLLQEAFDATDPAARPVVAEHLGDSLWRARRYDEAVAVWRDARDALPDGIGGLGAELQQRLDARLDAAERGEQPPIARSPAIDGVDGPAPGAVSE